MKKTYEAWEWGDDESGWTISFGLAGYAEEERSRGLRPAGAKLLHRFEAGTWEEAMAEHYARMGWGEYVPQGEPRDCPNGCGARFYPEGSGECPNCGRIC